MPFSRLALLLSLLLLSGLLACTTTKKQIQRGSLAASQPALPSQGKICGSFLKKEPKSKVLKQNGKVGVWVSKRRYLCLIVRQRIALACRKACSKSLTNLQKRCSSLIQNQKTFYKNRIKELERQRLYLQIGLGGVLAYGILSTFGNVWLLLQHGAEK